MASINDGFTHLEVHSHYTLLGSTLSVEQMVARAAKEELPALAITDHNALYGAVSFTKACKSEDIKPIVGMTVHLDANPGVILPKASVWGKLVLLATGQEGYRSLCQLASFLQSGMGQKPQDQKLSWEMLSNHKRGLICLTGGRHGWIEALLRSGQAGSAARFVSRLGGLFEEHCYLSINPIAADDFVTHEVISLGKRFGVASVAVQPIYCLNPEDASRLRLLAAINQNCRLEEVEDGSLPTMGKASLPVHWPSVTDIKNRFAAHPESLAVAADIVDICQPGLPDGRPIWPVLDLPDRHTEDQALAIAARAGLLEKYGSDLNIDVQLRLDKELTAISQHGFSPLFLIVADIVRFAREERIPVNTRGSVANSLVAFCIGITHVDPIAHDLLFERFLNPARKTLPDIDLDFCSRRRDEILNYVRFTYGEDQVALVGTMNTLQMRSAVRECAKAFGLNEVQIKRLAENIPRRWHPDPRRRKKWQLDDILNGLEDEQQAVLRAASDITGQPHHLSVHPGGVIMTPGPLTDVLPVQMSLKGFLITQFDHHDLEVIGLPKIDLLGIRALTVLADTVDLIRKQADFDFDLEKIPLEDDMTAALLSAGDTIGVFQCESAGARRTLRMLKAKNTRDLAVANAFFKPGPATGGMAPTFVRRYRGEEPVRFLNPALEPILGPTKGVLLFQEQILRIAWEIAGLSWEQADGLRKGMSKFQSQEMTALESTFVAGCLRPEPEGPGFSSEQAQTMWEQVAAFAGYGFNQGHATAYGDVSYRSAYLKAHYPAEFLCARLADRGGFHNPAIYMAEARRAGIAVRPPHVNVSGRVFVLDRGSEKTLWMGLGQVRDLRRKTVKAIESERASAPFASLADLLHRVELQRKEIENLIRSGGLDGLGGSRAQMLIEVEYLARAGGGRQLTFDFAKQPVVSPETVSDRFQWESHLLGMPVSVHPLDLVSVAEEHIPLRQLPRYKDQAVVVLGTKLPGWTGGKGFYLGDGDSFEMAESRSASTRREWKDIPWQPLRLYGRWREDEWGSGHFQAESITLLPYTYR